MNYRHAYHAGNFADVLKHAVLALILESLKRKDAPFFALDTHAGTGAYDLAAEEAGKTGEWRGGIGRLLDATDLPAALTPYADLVRAANRDGGLRWYPGSPAVIRALMRGTDRLALVELHPQDAETLRNRFGPDRRIGVHHMDGYLALRGLLPPPERRGLVLIDPPFEVKDEMERLRKALAGALKRWSTGIYAIWYPIKGRAAVDRFHADLTMLGLPKTLVAEVLIHGGDDPTRLNGSGMVIVNPPWQLDDSLGAMLPWLAGLLDQGGGSARLAWLVPEKS